MLHHNSLHRPCAKDLHELFDLHIDADLKCEQEHSWFAKLCQTSSGTKNLNVEPLTSTVSLAAAPQPINFMVNWERYPHFVGRDKLLDHLHHIICDTSPRKYNHRVAIYGCGGIGKTQIALEYTYRYSTFYENVFWISANSESDLLAGFQDIANITGCAQSNLSSKEQARLVLNWLRRRNNWLLVLDNLDDVSVVKGYLPERSEKRHTFITTRNPYAKDIPAEGLEIPLLNSEDAIDLLHLRSEVSPAEFNPDEALEIAVELDHLPLALEQAAAFIREATKSLRDYLTVYRKSRKSLLKCKPSGNDAYPDAVGLVGT
jgi:hypothetical protein